MAELTVYPDLPSFWRGSADKISDVGILALAQRGRFTVALAGGHTPAGVYRALSAPPIASRLNWLQVHLFWGDERCVPPDDSGSNYGMARRELIIPLSLPADNVHRIEGELPPVDAAREYEICLARFFKGEANEPIAIPRFDLVLLGMGVDGHVASLFPGSVALEATDRWIMPVQAPGGGGWRVTLTLNVINAARKVFFLVTGAEKAQTLREVLNSSIAHSTLPARYARPSDGQACWLVDAAAASLL